MNFNHKTTELGPSPELDALLVAAMRDADNVHRDATPSSVWLPNYDSYVEMCKAINVEPLAREEARTSPVVVWGEAP